jgi:hypothetical protein
VSRGTSSRRRPSVVLRQPVRWYAGQRHQTEDREASDQSVGGGWGRHLLARWWHAHSVTPVYQPEDNCPLGLTSQHWWLSKTLKVLGFVQGHNLVAEMGVVAAEGSDAA